MRESYIYILIISLVVGVGMQVYSIMKIQEVYKKTKGIIRSRRNLTAVKSTINTNMKLAVLYIVLSILLFIIVVVYFVNGTPGQGLILLFVFGVVTLPLGLIGKHFENKIKSMDV